MAKRWWIGVASAFTVIALAGVGFSAFTASATVSGTISAGSAQIQFGNYLGHGCVYESNGAPGPGSLTFSGLNPAATSIDLGVQGINLGEYCDGALQITNTGTGPVTLTIGILFLGENGICAADQTNCFDVVSASGISASGYTCLNGSPTPCGTSAGISTDFATLTPGQTYTDDIGVAFAPGSGTSSPTSGAFELVYIATEVS